MGKHVLLAPIGTEAQIVTTSIDLLRRKNIAINETIVLHSKGDPQLEIAAKFLNDALTAYPDLVFTIKPFEKDGKFITNLDTEKEVDILFYCLYNEVRRQKTTGSSVYLLCSGGRKITAAYAMLVAQMLFDESDKLLYLISKGTYLSSKKLHPESDEDLKNAHLLEIPFLGWSAILPSVTEFRAVEDPAEAYLKIKDLQLEFKYRQGYDFIENHCTKAEQKVLKLAAGNGMSNIQIAEKLVVSERTVETHMRSMLRKGAAYFANPELTRPQLIVLTQTYYQMKFKEK